VSTISPWLQSSPQYLLPFRHRLPPCPSRLYPPYSTTLFPNRATSSSSAPLMLWLPFFSSRRIWLRHHRLTTSADCPRPPLLSTQHRYLKNTYHYVDYYHVICSECFTEVQSSSTHQQWDPASTCKRLQPERVHCHKLWDSYQ
jgi:hypothetical protein